MLQLVAMAEIQDVIARLSVVEFDGQPYVNARDLARAVGSLTGQPSLEPRADGWKNDRFPLDRPQRLPDIPVEDDGVTVRGLAASDNPHAPVPTALELEQRRLDALPLGPCAMCRHLEHDGGQCPDCGCDNYVDTVNRDPVVSLAERGIRENPEAENLNPGGTIAPAISPFGAEAGLPNWKERPPLGHHRPPSG
jgi:hypothetical protein